MKRALMLASVASMIDQFNMSNIELLQRCGYKVDVACNFIDGNTCSSERIDELKKKLDAMDVDFYQVDFARNVLKINQHITSYRQVSKLMKNKYDLVHCHSPIGGLICRLAGKKYRKSGTKMIYTAHGFHFYKGAPLKNWMIYYPIEKMCSRYTDVLITINKEDYQLAQNKMKAKEVVYVPGVGIDTSRFADTVVDRLNYRRTIGIPDEAFMLMSVGELNANKNHEAVIRALAELNEPQIHYAIVGRGGLQGYLTEIAKELGFIDRLHFLGFRTDVAQLYKTADCFIHPSKREGLPVSVMEAMASGLPVIASKIRGNSDLIDDSQLFDLADPGEMPCLIKKMYTDDTYRISVGKRNAEHSGRYSRNEIGESMKLLYEQC